MPTTILKSVCLDALTFLTTLSLTISLAFVWMYAFQGHTDTKLLLIVLLTAGGPISQTQPPAHAYSIAPMAISAIITQLTAPSNARLIAMRTQSLTAVCYSALLCRTTSTTTATGPVF